MPFSSTSDRSWSFLPHIPSNVAPLRLGGLPLMAWFISGYGLDLLQTQMLKFVHLCDYRHCDIMIQTYLNHLMVDLVDLKIPWRDFECPKFCRTQGQVETVQWSDGWEEELKSTIHGTEGCTITNQRGTLSLGSGQDSGQDDLRIPGWGPMGKLAHVDGRCMMWM